ncbi:MAG: DUF952 domain-containing protein [Candidatus Algichlamydia australiensis]|nr:DUF952 domain-containing protein [Chlamydiales bacterium]
MKESLYKILSLKAWQESQTQEFLTLSENDKKFIHFSTKEQLPRILKKHWLNETECVILRVDPKQLLGKLVFESNPGGTNQYYHLYGGAIPLKAVHVITEQTLSLLKKQESS